MNENAEAICSSKSHKNTQNLKIFPGRRLSFVDVESFPSLLPRELQRLWEGWRVKLGCLEWAQARGKEEVKSPGT